MPMGKIYLPYPNEKATKIYKIRMNPNVPVKEEVKKMKND
jgi:hypothetical protein